MATGGISCWEAVLSAAVQDGLEGEGQPVDAEVGEVAHYADRDADVQSHLDAAEAVVDESRSRLQAAVARSVRLLRSSPPVADLISELESWLTEGGRIQAHLEDGLRKGVAAVDASIAREESARAEGRACRRAFELHLAQSSREMREASRRQLDTVREMDSREAGWAEERERLLHEHQLQLGQRTAEAAQARAELGELSAVHAQQLRDVRRLAEEREARLGQQIRAEEEARARVTGAARQTATALEAAQVRLRSLQIERAAAEEATGEAQRAMGLREQQWGEERSALQRRCAQAEEEARGVQAQLARARGDAAQGTALLRAAETARAAAACSSEENEAALREGLAAAASERDEARAEARRVREQSDDRLGLLGTKLHQWKLEAATVEEELAEARAEASQCAARLEAAAREAAARIDQATADRRREAEEAEQREGVLQQALERLRHAHGLLGQRLHAQGLEAARAAEEAALARAEASEYAARLEEAAAAAAARIELLAARRAEEAEAAGQREAVLEQALTRVQHGHEELQRECESLARQAEEARDRASAAAATADAAAAQLVVLTEALERERQQAAAKLRLVGRAAEPGRVGMLQAQLQDSKRAAQAGGAAATGAEHTHRGAGRLALGVVHASGGAMPPSERESASWPAVGEASSSRSSSATAALWQPYGLAPELGRSLGKGQEALAHPAIQATLKELLDEW
eukprot:scaffold3291_cov109-Isochrysis_galbana.AAC.4